MTEQIRRFRQLESAALPKTLAEYPAWLAAKYGLPGVVCALAVAAVVPVYNAKEAQAKLYQEQTAETVRFMEKLTARIEADTKARDESARKMQSVSDQMLEQLRAIREQQLRASNVP